MNIQDDGDREADELRASIDAGERPFPACCMGSRPRCAEEPVMTEPAIGGQWIAVTERLPELGRYVLVYEAGTSTADIYIDFLADEAYWSDTDHVTHWMPLPEPPTEASPEARGEQL